MSAEQKNSLIIHGDLQHVSILAEIEVFGHNFRRKEPMDFAISSKFDPKVCAYLEIGKEYVLHEEEPIMLNEVQGYQSDGNVITLELQGDCKLPHGIYPLKAETKKSGE